MLARSDEQLDRDTLAPRLEAVAFVLLAEQIRPDAAQTIAYFAQQGVAMKVISGDSPHTVAAVAARVGLPTPTSQ